MASIQVVDPSTLGGMKPPPPYIIAVINKMINKHWNGRSSILSLKELIGVSYMLGDAPSLEYVARSKWVERTIEDIKDMPNCPYVITEFGKDNNISYEFLSKKYV